MFRFTTAAAILGMTTAFAQPVLAESQSVDHADITCEAFMAMNENDRNMAMDSLLAGRDEAREEARGDDGGSTDTDMSANTTSDQSVDGGREKAREEARGDDMARVMKDCETDASMKVMDVMMHPSDK